MSVKNYSKKDLQKQVNYIIVIAPENDMNAFNKSIEVAKEYVKKDSVPKVVIFSDNCNEFQKIKYSQVQTFKAGNIRIVDRKDESDDFEVARVLSRMLKHGMILIDENVDFNNDTAEMLLSVSGKGQDYLIHRDEIRLFDAEIDAIKKEYKMVQEYSGEGFYKPEQNIILRLHDFPEFPFNSETLVYLYDSFGKIHGFTILLAYFLARKKTILFKQKLEAVCKQENENFADFINPHEFKKQSKNYVYYSFLTGQIINENEEFVEHCATELAHILRDAAKNK